MSDEVLAPILVVVILLVLFLWVPTLDVCSDRCQKLLRGRTRKAKLPAAAETSAAGSSRLRDVA